MAEDKRYELNSRAESYGVVAPGEQFTEIGIVTHEGKDFSAGGATVTDDFLIAYLSSGHVVSTWGGQHIGRYRVTQSWPTPRSFLSSRMYQVYVTLDDGRRYQGRSGGEGLIVRAKRVAAADRRKK